MAESGLSVDINGLRVEIGIRQGWGRDISAWKNKATKLADFDYISKRALREFYYPAIDPGTPYYEWSFLRKAGQITLVTADYDYDLPDDFGGTVLDESVTYAAGVDQPHLAKVSEGTIRQLRMSETSTGYPAYYAVRNKAHAPTTGQRWEMLTHPTPGADQNTKVIDYRYVYIPDALTNTNKYPVGGGQYSQVILAAHLAAMELVLEHDPAGPERQNFITLLTTAVRLDEEQKQNQGGGVA